MILSTLVVSFSLCWQNPTENVDGTALDDLESVTVYWENIADSAINGNTNYLTSVPGEQICQTIQPGVEGDFNTWATATDVEGNTSADSNIVTKTAADPANNAVQYVVTAPNPNVSTQSFIGESIDIRFSTTIEPGSADDARIISKASGTLEQEHDFMVSLSGGQFLRFRLKTDGLVSTLVGQIPVPIGTPFTGRAYYDGAQMQLFVDDVADSTLAKTGTIVASDNAIGVGVSPDGYGPLNFSGDLVVSINGDLPEPPTVDLSLIVDCVTYTCDGSTVVGMETGESIEVSWDGGDGPYSVEVFAWGDSIPSATSTTTNNIFVWSPVRAGLYYMVVEGQTTQTQNIEYYFYVELAAPSGGGID